MVAVLSVPWRFGYLTALPRAQYSSQARGLPLSLGSLFLPVQHPRLLSTKTHVPADTVSGQPQAESRRKAQAYKDTKSTGQRAHRPANRSESNSHTDRKLPREQWQIQKQALKGKFGGEAWSPRKKLSPDALEGIKDLHAQDPEKYSTSVLAESFQVSAEAIRRILRSKWTPSDAERADRERRWQNRGKAIWSQMAELGFKPPKKWRREGVGKIQSSHSPEKASNVILATPSSSLQEKRPRKYMSNRIL